MWVLRRPTDITQVTCINLNEPFTIGRIECSFNITDDKSVSRRHASITFPPSLILPLLTDCNSKFGTFVNGDRVTTPVQLKHGDTVKFGGATSEFVVEAKDFTVYTKSQKIKGMFRELKAKFGIEVVTNMQEAAYFVIDDNEQINEIDTDLIFAFLSCKCIVSPSYFSQLLQSNTMSLGLIQPTITSKIFPVDCWLPRKERLNMLRNAFEGINRLVLLGGDKNENMVKIIGNALGIETKSIQSYELRELKFNELFVVSSIYPDAKDLKDPIRIVKYQSIIEAVVRCDGKLIEVNTVYPEKPKELERNVAVDEQPKERLSFLKETPSFSIESKERVLLVDQSMPLERLPSSIELPLPAPINDLSLSQDLDYKGPSLTAVVPMPSTLLRSAQSKSSSVEPGTNGKKPKFVKCHPRHRLPGTIPALFGPDQLQPCRPTTIVNSNISGNVQGLKRRVLVKDSWLAEDDLVDEDAQGSSAATIVVKENKLQRNIEQVTNSYSITNVDKSNQTNSINQITTNISSNNTNTIPPSASTTNIPNPASNSKFQSSFFKNLSKGK